MTISQTSLTEALNLFEVRKDVFVSQATLREWLPTVEIALFFAKVMELDYRKLGELLRLVFNSSVVQELTLGDHSTELQDYLVDVVPDHIWAQVGPTFVARPVPGEVLPQLWASASVEVARSIEEVAAKVVGALALLPSKQGELTFRTMMRMNRLRPTVGEYAAVIEHARVPNVLVVLDVSGSMTEQTIRTIIDDVVSLSWEANAHLAIVSNQAFFWEPGNYSVEDVLKKAEYAGTHYEQLKPLFDRDWGTVVTIADYDSSGSVKSVIADCTGRIGTVLDISLVERPTFLAECVGQLADEVRPLLVAQGI